MLILWRDARELGQLGRDMAVFKALGTELDQHGVSWIMLKREPDRPWMMVNAPHSFDGTYLYIGEHAVLRDSGVYGFGDLYLGPAGDAAKVATRLTWLLQRYRPARGLTIQNV
jgi:hypothetical protein